MNRLNRQAGPSRDGGLPPQLAEDFLDQFALHDGHVIRYSDSWQGGAYPKCVAARELKLCEKARMSERAFDPELVRQKMKERKVSQTALADLVGLPSQSAMSNILKGRRQVKAHEAKIINDFLGIAPQPEVMRIPIIGITAAGKWREAVQMPMGFLPVAPRSAGDRCFALEVSGDSMDKLVPDGGWVVIDPDRKELRPGSIYLLLDGWEQATVKMYLRDPSRFEPCSTNENHKPFLVSDEDFTVVGKVILMISPAP